MSNLTTIYMLGGLPGAGKSLAADEIRMLTGGEILNMGDKMREEAAAAGVDTDDSHALGEFAASAVEEHGRGFLAERIHGEVLRDEYEPYDPLIIDGIRHRDEVIEFRDMAPTTNFIWLDADFDTRLERIQNRGRGDEAEFDGVDLMQRDDREIAELGVKSILDDQSIVDFTVTNDGDLMDLRSSLDAVVNYS